MSEKVKFIVIKKILEECYLKGNEIACRRRLRKGTFESVFNRGHKEKFHKGDLIWEIEKVSLNIALKQGM
jgi:hypothetical protein